MGEGNQLLRISDRALYNMMRAVIESWPNEEFGMIYGYRGSEVFRVKNAYPVINSDRKQNSVETILESAERRLKGLDSLIDANNGMSVLGEFHSHVLHKQFNYQSDYKLNKLSTADLKEIELGLKKINPWIEVLIKVQARSYTEKKRIGETNTQYERKHGIIVRSSENGKPFTYKGFNLTLIGYKVELTDNQRGLRVRELKVIRGNRRKTTY